MFKQWWGWAIGAALLLILILVAVWITSRNKSFHRNYNSAMKIITDKHLKGQINGEEYKRLMKELQDKHGKNS